MDKIPGVKGWGSDTRGAYAAPNGLYILIVNTLEYNNDVLVETTRNGVTVYTGSLFRCCSDTAVVGEGYGRIILFETSGSIVGDNGFHEDGFSVPIWEPFTEIWGATAPAPGISLNVLKLAVTVTGSDIVLSHLRVRCGDSGRPDENTRSSIRVSSGTDILVDHCSLTWGVDDCVGIWGTNIQDITFWNCMITEGFDQTPDYLNHGYGMTSDESDNILAMQCLFYGNRDRYPNLATQHGAIVNCLLQPPDGVVFCNDYIRMRDLGLECHWNVVGNLNQNSDNDEIALTDCTHADSTGYYYDNSCVAGDCNPAPTDDTGDD